MSDAVWPQCASCPYDWPERQCMRKGGKGPKSCPTLRHKQLAREAAQRLDSDPAVLEFARQACVQELSGYGYKNHNFESMRAVKPRIQEIVEFARRMNYKRLGLAFCIGLRMEAGVVERIFKDYGFEAVSFMCKAGRADLASIGVTPPPVEELPIADEPMCNPVFQAMLANEHKVELNVLLGLCVGHDSLFIKYAEAPVTVLAVKDRLLGHNPLAAIYQYDSYSAYLKKK